MAKGRREERKEKRQGKAISKAFKKQFEEGTLDSGFKIDETADPEFGTPKLRNLPSEPIPTNPQLSRVGPDAATKEKMSKLGETIGKSNRLPRTWFSASDNKWYTANDIDPTSPTGDSFNEEFIDQETGEPYVQNHLSNFSPTDSEDPEDAEYFNLIKRNIPLLKGIQDPNPDNLLKTQRGSSLDMITLTPEDRLKAQMDKNNAIPTLTNVLLDESTKNAQTSNELFEAPKVVDDAKQVAEKEISNLNNAAQKEISALGDNSKVYVLPYGFNDDEWDNLSEDEKNAFLQNQNSSGTEVVTEGGQTEVIPGSGQTVSNIVSSGENERPSYDQIATKDKVANDITSQYLKAQGNVPYAVVEKLGVQDYYPNIGRDIAVGTFSGSRIGSQTIYSGAGALLPMGLYDARKRALKDAAKSKQAEIDKILSVPDTTPQLQSAFTEYALKIKSEDLARNNYDPSLYSRDLESRKHDLMLEAVAKDLIYATKNAQSLLDATMPKDGKPGNYMPEEQKKMLRELLSGTMEDPEAYFSGKKNINNYSKNVKSYSDGTVWVDGMIKTWLANPTEVPVNLKTGQSLTEDQLDELNSALNGYLQAVKDGSADTDSYMTMIRKYYDIDEAIVDKWADAQEYEVDDKMRGILKDYLKYQIPADSFVQSIKTSANQNVARARLALDRAKFNYQKEQDAKSFWSVINAGMSNAVNKQTGKSFDQELAELNKKGLSRDQLKVELQKLYNSYSVSPQGQVVQDRRGNWVVQMPSTSTQAQQITSKNIKEGGKDVRKFGVSLQASKNMTINGKSYKKGDWIYQELTPSGIMQKLNDGSFKQVTVGGKNLRDKNNQAIVQGFNESQNQMYTKVTGHEIMKAYIDPRTGDAVPLASYNIAEYNANTKVVLTRNVEKGYAKFERGAGSEGKTDIVEVALPGETRGPWIQLNPSGIQWSDEQSGYTTRQAAEAQGDGTTTTITSSNSGFNF